MPKLKMTATVFAIRDADSGNYMPQLRSSRYSLLEVDEFVPAKPRLFWTCRGARQAIAAWKRGVHAKGGMVHDSYFGESDYDPGGYPIGKPPENRVKVNLEVVEFELAEK